MTEVVTYKTGALCTVLTNVKCGYTRNNSSLRVGLLDEIPEAWLYTNSDISEVLYKDALCLMNNFLEANPGYKTKPFMIMNCVIRVKNYSPSVNWLGRMFITQNA
jgi:hypothetical protein